MSELKTETMQEFCSRKSVTNIGKVAMSKEGRPFVTFLGDFEGGAECIWFSIAQSERVEEGQKASEIGIKDLVIAHTENEAGEPRLKISGNSGKYESVEDLLA